jgi:hypothetical protein
MQPKRRVSSSQSTHRYVHLSELPASWHLPHAGPQIEQRASPRQDGSGEHAGPPKGPPLPIHSLV